MTDVRSQEVRRFGPFQFDVMEQRLFREGKEIKLRRKAFAILRHLTAHPQRLVSQAHVSKARRSRTPRATLTQMAALVTGESPPRIE